MPHSVFADITSKYIFNTLKRAIGSGATGI